MTTNSITFGDKKFLSKKFYLDFLKATDDKKHTIFEVFNPNGPNVSYDLIYWQFVFPPQHKRFFSLILMQSSFSTKLFSGFMPRPSALTKSFLTKLWWLAMLSSKSHSTKLWISFLSAWVILVLFRSAKKHWVDLGNKVYCMLKMTHIVGRIQKWS